MGFLKHICKNLELRFIWYIRYLSPMIWLIVLQISTKISHDIHIPLNHCMTKTTECPLCLMKLRPAWTFSQSTGAQFLSHVCRIFLILKHTLNMNFHQFADLKSWALCCGSFEFHLNNTL